MHLSIQNISKSYGGRDIFTDFSLEVQSGVRLCLCGPNGSGKSTLLRMLAGVETLDAGRVTVPRASRMGFVMQELTPAVLEVPLLDFVLEVLPDWSDFWQEWEKAGAARDAAALLRLAQRQSELEHLYGYNPEQRAKEVLSGLGFEEHKWRRPMRNLSGGWRERAKLARVLTAGADVLLLDEPTNHLDLDAVEWLENFLLDYKGILIFVAHDRVFMDKIGTHLLYLGASKPLFRKGNFTQFIAMQEEFSMQREREAARLQDEIERKMDFVRRFKAKATKARQAASRQKMAKRLEKELEGLDAPQKRRELDFAWPEPPQPGRSVLSVADLRFGFPDGRRMWESLSFNIYRGQKVALVGPNGCGKSTLLKLLTGRLEREGGSIAMDPQVRMGYFSQHQLETINPNGTVLGEIRRLSDPRSTEEELMSVLGLFLLGQNYFDRPAGSLSGGEKSRLILACLFLARCNFLILDEPTHHLDLESREALVEALGAFKGTILLVAHDRHLLSEAAEQIWALTPEGFSIYPGGYAEYSEARKQAKLAGSQPTAEITPGAAAGDALFPPCSREEQKRLKREQAELRNQLYKKQKPLHDEYSKLEKDLEQLLERQGEVESLLAAPEVYADSARTTKLLKEFHQLQQRSEDIMAKLALLEDKIRDLEAMKQNLG
ncbi:MAG: ABC-F family ATP-binding cassette domain-containing protein [Deltaproteobacteria bacterium]|jgi:ATP-binding cassette subfamily F protein 3|nr:ABC-F family ATP-binding cassette domain-containing protein [Deltaproteobacteria bacterium]